jgi:hypothetical protein
LHLCHGEATAQFIDCSLCADAERKTVKHG